ncbi:hypothetical protein [Amycolatopsis pretoriensis]|uniref:hypothetical protein n=1 Tax=Amycolatopsis pretoriensis TaxID=218821 RepID=UPI000A36D502|nr:hypothetical protein [Amycolatopsis pretoriensis]
MPYTAEPRVDAYSDALPEWQRAICREVRELVHAADPEVVETIKRTRQPQGPGPRRRLAQAQARVSTRYARPSTPR